MKQLLRRLYSPILNPLEAGTEPYAYKPSHRTILMIIGGLFSALAIGVLLSAPKKDPGFLIPVIVFLAVGVVTLGVSALGNDRAVAKIWGTK